MKIVIIDECVDRVGGVERIVCTLANFLEKKYQVEVISELKTRNQTFYKYNDSINIKYLINMEKSKTIKMKNKNLLYYIMRAFEKINNKIHLKKQIIEILKNVSEEDIIIFGRVFTALDFLPILEQKKLKPKIIVRDAIHLKYYSKGVRRKIKTLFPKNVDTFIVSSDESKEEYRYFFGNEQVNMEKIYNPLGIIPKECGNVENKTIVSVGRMDSQKGYESLIMAYKILLDNGYDDWKLKIYGEGKYQEKIEKIILKFNLKDKVIIKPSTKNITEVFDEAAIFVLPSRYEGYANILVEAMSCSMPVISYNWLMGVEEIIENRVNGIVVPLKDRYRYFCGKDKGENDINLANALKELIENKELYYKIKNEANKIVKTRNVERIIENWITLINNRSE